MGIVFSSTLWIYKESIGELHTLHQSSRFLSRKQRPHGAVSSTLNIRCKTNWIMKDNSYHS